MVKSSCILIYIYIYRLSWTASVCQKRSKPHRICITACFYRTNQRLCCHWRQNDCCSLTAVSDFKCVLMYVCVQGLQAIELKGFQHSAIWAVALTHMEIKTMDQNLYPRCAGPESVFSLGYVCASMCAPVIPNKGMASFGCFRRNRSDIAQSMPVWPCSFP